LEPLPETDSPAGLILTVGLSPEPISYSIRSISPEFIALLGTESSLKHFEKIRDQISRPSGRVRTYVVSDSESADTVRKIGLIVEDWFRRGVTREHIVVDSTGGTKPMTGGAMMAAAFYGLRNVYVNVERDPQTGKILADTMKIIELTDPHEILGYVEAKIALHQMNSHNYHTAASMLKELSGRTSDFRLRDLWESYRRLAEALELWDRFDFSKARKALQELESAFLRHAKEGRQSVYAKMSEEIGERLVVLDELAKEGPSQLKLFELFSNANRRMRQGRYDDSCARTYRCLEAIAQHVLTVEFGLTQPEIGKIGGLEKCYVELSSRGHPLGIKFSRIRDKFTGLLTLRNNSILAHGWQPIGEEGTRSILGVAEEFLREYCRGIGVDFDLELSKVQHPLVEMPPSNI